MPVAVELAGELGGQAEAVTSGPDRLVRLLGVLHAALVAARRVRHVLGSVSFGRLRPGRSKGRFGQGGRIGAHVRDVPSLVEALGDTHRRLGRKPELATRLLLERRGHERWRRLAGVRLLFDRPNGEGRVGKPRGKTARGGLVELHRVDAQRSIRPEVPSRRNPLAVEAHEPSLERAGIEHALEVPVRRGDEAHAAQLALDDEPRGH